MHIPPYLKKGDTIAITCPSGYLSSEKIIDAVQHFEDWGLNVVVGKTVGSESQNYFSGTDIERLQELQIFLNDSSINAIMMGRGGYGLSRIIDQLNFDNFIQNPKWICGFSDITLLHSHILENFNIATLHSSMCAAFQPKENWNPAPVIGSIKEALFNSNPINIQTNSFSMNKIGTAKGALVGGNLAMISHSIGSKSQINTNGTILFLEDIGEHLYKIDRMLIQLKRAGMLDSLAGIIFGQFTDCEDTLRPFGTDLYTLISHHFEDYYYPIAYNFPIGHDDMNLAVKMGIQYELNVEENLSILKEI